MLKALVACFNNKQTTRYTRIEGDFIDIKMNTAQLSNPEPKIDLLLSTYKRAVWILLWAQVGGTMIGIKRIGIKRKILIGLSRIPA